MKTEHQITAEMPLRIEMVSTSVILFKGNIFVTFVIDANEDRM